MEMDTKINKLEKMKHMQDINIQISQKKINPKNVKSDTDINNTQNSWSPKKAVSSLIKNITKTNKKIK